jgi:integrase/recombinase XerD
MSNHTHRNKKSRRPIKSKLLNEYCEFSKTYQGVCESTLTIRSNDLFLFLAYLKKDAMPSRIRFLSTKRIHDYVIKVARTMTRSARKSLSSSLRSFLRFLHVQGYLKKDLREAVPLIVTQKLESIPRGITWKDAKKLLHCPDRSTSLGRRNYAILQLILNYGVRINQATHLRINDIHWDKGHIHFPQCKWNKALCFPLKPIVAKAILSYLRHDRGDAPFPEIFLSDIGERRPLSYRYCLGQTFQAYYKKAGIDSPVSGAHAIRHAFATRLMEKRTPIKVIADLLGHRSIRSTFIYTKVDVPQLRLLARRWPKERGDLS